MLLSCTRYDAGQKHFFFRRLSDLFEFLYFCLEISGGVTISLCFDTFSSLDLMFEDRFF